jgi:hypothetical protein
MSAVFVSESDLSSFEKVERSLGRISTDSTHTDIHTCRSQWVDVHHFIASPLLILSRRRREAQDPRASSPPECQQGVFVAPISVLSGHPDDSIAHAPAVAKRPSVADSQTTDIADTASEHDESEDVCSLFIGVSCVYVWMIDG